MVIAVAATFSAAALVMFLQQRAISARQSQTRTNLRQLSEQTAADIAAELLWNDARRIDYFAELGFIVDPAQMRCRREKG